MRTGSSGWPPVASLGLRCRERCSEECFVLTFCLLAAFRRKLTLQVCQKTGSASLSSNQRFAFSNVGVPDRLANAAGILRRQFRMGRKAGASVARLPRDDGLLFALGMTMRGLGRACARPEENPHPSRPKVAAPGQKAPPSQADRRPQKQRGILRCAQNDPGRRWARGATTSPKSPRFHKPKPGHQRIRFRGCAQA
jgi:hypothetical protein